MQPARHSVLQHRRGFCRGLVASLCVLLLLRLAGLARPHRLQLGVVVPGQIEIAHALLKECSIAEHCHMPTAFSELMAHIKLY